MGRLFQGTCAVALVLGAGAGALAQPTARALPEPSRDPMRLDPASDPILQLGASRASFDQFRDVIAAAVRRHPATREQEATTDEARAVLAEARERRLPSVDATVTSYRVISREFSNDQDNIIERSRPDQRTDATLSVQQTLFDFGANNSRVRAAGARLRAAALDAEATSDRVALSAIAAWYDMFAYRALTALTESFAESQRELRASVEERVRQGVSAPGDVARVESYIASAETRLARFRRQLANAEARFEELAGAAPPAAVERAPAPAAPVANRDDAALASARSPAVQSAERLAEAARQEARAARADRLPQVAAGIDAGRYGVFENERDYDIRGRVSVRQRLFGGVDARADQLGARARAVEARADRVREEAARDAAIAWSDVQALEAQLRALEASYIAARRSRDVIVERFRVARGSLFDVVAAEDTYFSAAAAYIEAIAELDAARYVLLSRTGRLLDALAIDEAAGEEAR
ncbi:MAG TPA: TolC family protein [Allosphingosinicella sp.]|nr:TolC family protein [Allosphingosinicella sp.]